MNIASIEKKRIIGNIKVDDVSYRLMFTYAEEIDGDRNIAGLILTMPAINFTYFARKLVLNFPVSPTGMSQLHNLLAPLTGL